MNTRNRSSITYNNVRSSGRFNVPGQFVSAGEQQPEAAAKPKKEPTTPNTNSNLQQVPIQNTDVEMNESSGPGLGQERPKWMKSKLQGVKKISNKERRRRQNQTLRRLLTPKNALMVLNEMVPHEQVANQFKVEPSPMPHHHYFASKSPHTFAAELTLEGANYKGYGENKLSARNACAELAIRDIIIKKMNKVMAADGSSNGAGAGEEADEDSLPMLQLASFALHKLFTEWEYDGHKVPQLKPHTASMSDAAMSDAGSVTGVPGGSLGGTKGTGKGAKKPRTLPSNAAAMHPCMLLTYLRPSLEYRELDATGDKPQSMTYTIGVTVDGKVYTGQASNKKEARKEAARAACQDLFNVVFDPQVTANAPEHN